MIEFLLVHPCVDCGESDIVVLECDHLRDKEFDMAKLLTGGSTWRRIERELAKCEVRCANCHRRKTASRSRTSFRRDYATFEPRGESPVEQLHLLDGSLRRCRVCDLVKPLVSFPFRSKARRTRQWICLNCQREYSRRWYVSRSPGAKKVVGYGSHRREGLQVRVVDYLRMHPCVDCGEDDVIVLDFDHLRDKLDSVLNLVASGQTWAVISQEISKCEVRCANCHRRRTARQVGGYRLRDGTPKVDENLRPRGDSNARPDGS